MPLNSAVALPDEPTPGGADSASIRRMFGQIAPRYDLMNRLMTAGQDRRWRRIALREAGLLPGERLLDLATGTGDIALMALADQSSLRVTAADFTLAMMRVGQRRLRGDRVEWCGADALHLPFPDGSFDAVISAYLARNLPPRHVLDGFREQVRVVKDGGRVVCLDATPPPPGPLLPLIRFYLNRVIPWLGALVAGQREAYTYLPRSAQAFKTGDELAALLDSAGLVSIHREMFMFGTITLLVGERATASRAVSRPVVKSLQQEDKTYER